jgi:hypothetical protein
MHVIFWYERGNITNVDAHLTDQVLVYDPLHFHNDPTCPQTRAEEKL